MNLNSAGVCIFENFQRLNIARGVAERNIQPLEIFKNTHPLPNDRKTWFAGRLVQWILLSRTKFFITCMIHFKADLMGSCRWNIFFVCSGTTEGDLYGCIL